MAQDLKVIGDMLQQRRKELNLSLKDIENGTCIRLSYLQAIEEGHMEKLISPIYAQGFAKQYASYIGLDGERLIAENIDVFKKNHQQDFTYGIGTLEPRGHPGAGVKWVPSALWMVAFCVLAVLGYYLARFLEVIS
jgi:cytoskeletal protein RodZ